MWYRFQEEAPYCLYCTLLFVWLFSYIHIFYIYYIKNFYKIQAFRIKIFKTHLYLSHFRKSCLSSNYPKIFEGH